MTGIQLIAAERRRQIEAEGRTAAHDATNNPGELAGAGAAYALNAACLLNPYHGTPCVAPPASWPHDWDRAYWKPSIERHLCAGPLRYGRGGDEGGRRQDGRGPLGARSPAGPTKQGVRHE